MTSNLRFIETKWARVGLLSLLLWSTASFAGTGSWEDSLTAATVATERGNYMEAESHLVVALKEAEQAGRPDPLMAASLADLAGAYAAQGDFEKAESLFKRGLVVLKTAPETDDQDINEYLKKLSVFYRAKAVFLRKLGTADGD